MYLDTYNARIDRECSVEQFPNEKIFFGVVSACNIVNFLNRFVITSPKFRLFSHAFFVYYNFGFKYGFKFWRDWIYMFGIWIIQFWKSSHGGLACIGGDVENVNIFVRRYRKGRAKKNETTKMFCIQDIFRFCKFTVLFNITNIFLRFRYDQLTWNVCKLGHNENISTSQFCF